METIKFLSSDALRGREIGTPGVESAAGYIADKFKRAGPAPGGDAGSFFQTGKDPAGAVTIF